MLTPCILPSLTCCESTMSLFLFVLRKTPNKNNSNNKNTLLAVRDLCFNCHGFGKWECTTKTDRHSRISSVCLPIRLPYTTRNKALASLARSYLIVLWCWGLSQYVLMDFFCQQRKLGLQMLRRPWPHEQACLRRVSCSRKVCSHVGFYGRVQRCLRNTCFLVRSSQRAAIITLFCKPSL